MKTLPIAVVEAKDNKHGVGDGMQQALAYAEALDLPFAFSSNGDGFLFHDRTAAAEQSRFTQARGARTRHLGAGSGIGAWHR